MKKIDFIFVGKAKESAFRDLEGLYGDKISHFARTSVITVKDSSEKDPRVRSRREGFAVLEKIDAEDFVVVCDERGKALDSIAFSRQLEKWQLAPKRLVFVIGGPYGISQELAARANALFSLSSFTLAHEPARIVLLEQVYRGLSILAGSKYHHA